MSHLKKNNYILLGMYYNQSILKEISPGYSLEGMMLNWNSSTLATSWEELTHWKRLWCWEGLGAGGEGDDRGWDGWMASWTRWTWVWVNSGRWWWTGRPGVLRFMGSQRVGHNWVTELNWDSILKSRDVTLPTKVHLVKAMVFPVVMYGCESWTVKKVERRRIDAFELWSWKRLLRVLGLQGDPTSPF